MMCIPKRFVALAAAATAWLTGCNGEEITRYQVPRVEKPAARDAGHKGAQRLLGVILPHGDRTWFVKLVGHPHAINDVKEPFARFLMSLEFAESGELKWKTPEGWTEKPGTGMRYATFVVGSDDEPMELTVTSLGAEASEILPNVNRWRGQLGAPPITEAQLGESTSEMQLAGVTATLVEFTASDQRAVDKSASAGTEPVAAGPTDGTPLDRGARTPPAAGALPARAPISYTTPEGWKVQPTTGPMRVAAFDVSDGDQHAEVTVIPLAGSGGTLLANVNRWRGQILLEPIRESELAAELRQIEVAGRDAQYIDMTGPASAGDRRQRMLVAAAARDGMSWFFKMTGPPELVQKQKGAFELFVRSVKFE